MNRPRDPNPTPKTEAQRRWRANKQAGRVRKPKDCANDGPSVATARRHQRNGGTAELKDCPNGCYGIWQKYQADQYEKRKNR